MPEMINPLLIAEYQIESGGQHVHVSEKNFINLAQIKIEEMFLYSSLAYAFFMSDSPFGRAVLWEFINRLNADQSIDYGALGLSLPTIKNVKLKLTRTQSNNFLVTSNIGFFKAAKLQEVGMLSLFCQLISHLFEKTKEVQDVRSFLSDICNNQEIKNALSSEQALGTKWLTTEALVAEIISKYVREYCIKELKGTNGAF